MNFALRQETILVTLNITYYSAKNVQIFECLYSLVLTANLNDLIVHYAEKQNSICEDQNIPIEVNYDHLNLAMFLWVPKNK